MYIRCARIVGEEMMEGTALNTRLEIVERLLDSLYTAGRSQVWELLTAELEIILTPVAIRDRYNVGLHWLDLVSKQLEAAGAVLPAMGFLKVLIRVGGDCLDQTVFLPTGLQQITLN